jgi:hypothetical protein
MSSALISGIRTIREHPAQELPNLTRFLGTIHGLFRQDEAPSPHSTIGYLSPVEFEKQMKLAHGRPSALATATPLSYRGDRQWPDSPHWPSLRLHSYWQQAAVLRDPAIAAGVGQWGAIQTTAP